MVKHGERREAAGRRETETDRAGDEGERGTIWVSASNAGTGTGTGTDVERRRGSVTWRRNCYDMAVP